MVFARKRISTPDHLTPTISLQIGGLYPSKLVWRWFRKQSERERIGFSSKYYANEGGLSPGNTSDPPISTSSPKHCGATPIDNFYTDGLLNGAIQGIEFDNRCKDRVGLSDDTDGPLVPPLTAIFGAVLQKRSTAHRSPRPVPNFLFAIHHTYIRSLSVAVSSMSGAGRGRSRELFNNNVHRSKIIYWMVKR